MLYCYHKRSSTKKRGGNMFISDVALIRTGIVSARKKSDKSHTNSFEYRLLNLKCVSVNGTLTQAQTEPFWSDEKLNSDFLTQKGDILVRLSAPYTAILIQRDEDCGLLVPSHFAIIRANTEVILPEYLLWYLKRESTYQQILQNASGSSSFGTISSGFLGTLSIRNISLPKQKKIGQLLLLSERENELLLRLAEEKKKYNQIMINTIYESVKRGK